MLIAAMEVLLTTDNHLQQDIVQHLAAILAVHWGFRLEQPVEMRLFPVAAAIQRHLENHHPMASAIALDKAMGQALGHPLVPL